MARKPRETCRECGAPIRSHRHGMNRTLANTLAKFHQQHGSAAGELSEVTLTYCERANFQKLRYWGLVQKTGDPHGKGGVWRITLDGLAFLAGRSRVPRLVWTYRGEVESTEGEQVSMEELVPGWDKRPDYARVAQVRHPEQPQLFTPPAAPERELL